MKPIVVMTTVALLLFAGTASAEVYRQVDAEGNVTFSDEPSLGAKAIKVKPVTTIRLPKMQDLEQPKKPQQDQRPSSLYDSVTIVYPANNEAFHSGNGNIEFRLTSSPPLRKGHKYEVTLDGQPVGQSATGIILVQQVDRGTHQAGVRVVNRNGVQVGSGTGVSFTIHRPSRLN